MVEIEFFSKGGERGSDKNNLEFIDRVYTRFPRTKAFTNYSVLDRAGQKLKLISFQLITQTREYLLKGKAQYG